MLASVLARAVEPAHAYATDEDAGAGGWIEGVDPEVSRRDLSDNPLSFYRKRFAVVQELWQRLQAGAQTSATPYDQLRRNFERSFRMMAEGERAHGPLCRRHHRSARGGGQRPWPAAFARGRAAAAARASTAYQAAVRGGRLPLQARVPRPHVARHGRALRHPESSLNKLDYSVAQRVLGLQKVALAQLLRDSVAARIIDAREQAPDATKVLTLPELYGTLQVARARARSRATPPSRSCAAISSASTCAWWPKRAARAGL